MLDILQDDNNEGNRWQTWESPDQYGRLCMYGEAISSILDVGSAPESVSEIFYINF